MMVVVETGRHQTRVRGGQGLLRLLLRGSATGTSGKGATEIPYAAERGSEQRGRAIGGRGGG